MFAAARSRLRGSLASERQLGARVTLAAVAVGVLAVPFSVLLLFVESKWRPLFDLDNGARDSLHGYAMAHHGFAMLMRAVSNSGSGLAWQVVTVAVAAALFWRRRVRVALFVVVANAGSSVLNTLVKTATDRSRPVVDHPLLTEPGKSFPSGHAQAAIVGYTVLLLVLLPYLHRGWRRPAITIAVVMVAAIGFSRVALSVHYVSDVVAAYLLGLAWVTSMASAFHVWRHASVAAPQADTTGNNQQAPGEPSAKQGSSAR
jgi:undecaprenyl-diphosphatase